MCVVEMLTAFNRPIIFCVPSYPIESLCKFNAFFLLVMYKHAQYFVLINESSIELFSNNLRFIAWLLFFILFDRLFSSFEFCMRHANDLRVEYIFDTFVEIVRNVVSLRRKKTGKLRMKKVNRVEK